jgi:anti-sigma B factor antagonist
VSTVENRGPSVFEGTTVVIAWPRSDLDLAQQIAESVELGARHVVIDLGDVEMVDSSTLTLLRRVAGRLRRAGGRLSVVCPHPGLAGLLHLTLLSQSFPVFGSLDAALRPAR